MSQMITTEEVAEIVGRPATTVHKWRNKGEGPPYRQLVEGGKVEYVKSEVLKWLKSRTRRPGERDTA